MGGFERDLRLYEIICARMNISFMIDFNAVELNKEHLSTALNYVKLKHPYLRMKLVDDHGNEVLSNEFQNAFQAFKYVEMNDNQKMFVPISMHKVNSEADFNQWQERLIHVANVDRNFSKSLIFLDVYSLNDTNRHQIYGCINHSGN